MTVFVNVGSLEANTQNRENLDLELYKMVQDVYDSVTISEETYLRLMDTQDITWGYEDPDQIIQTAKEWNPQIVSSFESALKAFLSPYFESKNPDDLPLDSTCSYELHRAVAEVDNYFLSCVYHATLLQPYQGHFNTLIAKDELEDICKNPACYALIEVYPK